MKKLKPDYGIVGLVPAIVSILALALISILYGIEYGLKALGVIIFIYAFLFGMWFYIKTGNSNFLVSFFYLLSFGLTLFFIEIDLSGRNERLHPDTTAKFFMVLMYFFGLWLFYLLFNKKLKWRGREVMELAALEVVDGENSFTERPKPVSIVDINRIELLEFAGFLKKNLIFHTHIKNEEIYLFPIKQGREYSLLYADLDLVKDTWIRIDFEGKVTVKVSQKDYLDYKYNLSFDQLTEALGHLVIDFARLFKKGEEVRIFDRINMVNVGYFS